MKGKWSFAIIVVLILGALVVYTFTGKEFPRIPSDSFHQGATDEKACVGCHGPGKKYELKKAHPPKFECLKCHKPGERK